MRTHYGPWQPCWISNQHQKHKSGRGPSSEYFWQVWLISVQRFQRRRFKCEKLTDGRTTTHDKSSHGLWPGELIKLVCTICYIYRLLHKCVTVDHILSLKNAMSQLGFKPGPFEVRSPLTQLTEVAMNLLRFL